MGTSCASLTLAVFPPLVGYILTLIIFILDDDEPNECLVKPCYCENRTNSEFRQPMNVFSGFIYLLICAMLSFVCALNWKTKPLSTFRKRFWYALLFLIQLSLLSASTIAFHIYLTPLTAILDGLSIAYLVSFLVCVAILEHLNLRSIFTFLIPWLILISITTPIIIWCDPLAHSIILSILIGIFVIHEILYFRTMGLFISILLFIAAIIIWSLSREDSDSLCESSLGHGFWHLLSGFGFGALYFHFDHPR
jgi:hypothetical protein